MTDLARREAVAWAIDCARPLPSTDPDDAAPGLAALLEDFPTATVVAAGESTHGTRDFFRLKDGLVRAMSGRGLSSVLFEANLPESLDVDAWIRTGAGEAGAALASMGFWTWDTEEVLDLLRWMRSSDAGARFLGIDVQSPTRSVERLHGLLAAPDLARSEAGLDLVATTARGRVTAGDAAALDELDHHLAALSASHSSPASAERALEVRMLLEHLRAWVRYSRPEDIWDVRRSRDESMARLALAWVSALAPGPSMLWAHNQHIGRDGFVGRFPSLGAHLAAALGEAYLPLGLMFGSGSFQATAADGSLVDHSVGEPDDELVESVLTEVPHDVYALDLRTAPASVRTWLRAGRAVRSIGSGFSGDRTARLVIDLAEQYDAIVFVRHAVAARRTASGRRHARVAPVALSVDEPLLSVEDLGGTARGWSLTQRSDGLPWRPVVVRHGDGLGVLVVREVPSHDRASVVLERGVAVREAAGRRLTWTAQRSLAEPTPGDTAVFAVASDGEGRPTVALGLPDDVRVVLDVPDDAVSVRVGVRISGAQPVLVHAMELRLDPTATSR